MRAAQNLDLTSTLRQALREATSNEHDRLDSLVTRLDLASPRDYAGFLSLQLMARRPIETWLAQRSVSFGIPPAQADLIAADLAALGAPDPGQVRFDPPHQCDPIGACWAIAGSSLGNRAMHRTLQRASPDERPPARFLGDDAMTGYWQGLKASLEASPSPERTDAAIAAARAVFAAFVAAAAQCLGAVSQETYS